MAALTVDLRTEDVHDFNQVSAELFPARFLFFILEDGNLDAHEIADLEDDFTAPAEQPVYVLQNQFFNLPLEGE